MKSRKVTVTIGIPAYNEEVNIKHLLESLLAQKQESFFLKEIIVISDGSTDKTVKIARSIKSPIIRIIDGKKRLGQSERQNQILSICKGDVLVIIEADTLPASDSTISELIKPFTKESIPNLGMTVGQAIRTPPKNFFERITIHGDEVKKEIFSKWRNGKNLYMSNGHAMRAFSSDFLGQLEWPKDVTEDSYAYLKLCQLGFSIVKQPNAIAYVKNVTNFEDRLEQSTKFISGKKLFIKYFSPEFVDNQFNIPKILIFKHLAKEFFQEPLLTILYLLQVISLRLHTLRTPNFTGMYRPYQSTKKLGMVPKFIL